MFRTILALPRAAWETPLFYGYLLAKGYNLSRRDVLLSLARVRPWENTDKRVAPWRLVRDVAVLGPIGYN
jgi:hypothetical protein